jgi:transcriptional regulator with XRE-family HTH domain
MLGMKTSPQPTDWREGRRLRAWELYQQGWPQKQIAAALGVSAGAVSQWLARGRAGEVEALRNLPRPNSLTNNALACPICCCAAHLPLALSAMSGPKSASPPSSNVNSASAIIPTILVACCALWA